MRIQSKVQEDKFYDPSNRASRVNVEELEGLLNQFLKESSLEGTGEDIAKNLLSLPWKRITLGQNAADDDVLNTIAQILCDFFRYDTESAKRGLFKEQSLVDRFVAYCAITEIALLEPVNSKSKEIETLDSLAALFSFGKNILMGKNSPVTAVAFDLDTAQSSKLLVAYNDSEEKLTLSNGEKLDSKKIKDLVAMRIKLLKEARETYQSMGETAVAAKKAAADLLIAMGGYDALSDISTRNEDKEKVAINHIMKLLMNDELPLWSISEKVLDVLVFGEQGLKGDKVKEGLLHAEQHIMKYFLQKQIQHSFKEKHSGIGRQVVLPPIKKVTVYNKDQLDNLNLDESQYFLTKEKSLKKGGGIEKQLFWISKEGFVYKVEIDSTQIKKLLKDEVKLVFGGIDKAADGEILAGKVEAKIEYPSFPYVTAKKLAPSAIPPIGISMLSCGKCEGTFRFFPEPKFTGAHFRKFTKSGVSDFKVIFGKACRDELSNPKGGYDKFDQALLKYHVQGGKSVAESEHQKEAKAKKGSEKEKPNFNKFPTPPGSPLDSPKSTSRFDFTVSSPSSTTASTSPSTSSPPSPESTIFSPSTI